jgi:hypothetical protein
MAQRLLSEVANVEEKLLTRRNSGDGWRRVCAAGHEVGAHGGSGGHAAELKGGREVSLARAAGYGRAVGSDAPVVMGGVTMQGWLAFTTWVKGAEVEGAWLASPS